MKKFSIWLENQLHKKEMTATELSERIDYHYTYIWKLLKKDHKPSRSIALAIGDAFDDRQGALEAAGFLQKALPPYYLQERPSSSIPTMRALDWLREADIFSSSAVAFGKELLTRSIEWSQGESQQAQRREFEASLFKHLMRYLSHLTEGIQNKEDLLHIMAEIGSLRMDPVIDIKESNIDNLLVNPNLCDASLYFMTRILDRTSLNKIKLSIPVVFLPVSVLRASIDKDLTEELSSQALLRAKETQREINEHNTNIRNYRNELYTYPKIVKDNLTKRELSMMWNDAKREVIELWDYLEMKFEVLKTPEAYYDLVHLYFPPVGIKDPGTIVFSRTSGLIDPAQHYGSMLRSKLKCEKDPLSYFVNPYRYAYFLNGIIRGCESGCRIRYQFDGRLTAEIIKNNIECSEIDRNTYLEKAASIFTTFLQLPNLEITIGDFTKAPAGFERADWRDFLSINNVRFTAISTRHTPPPEVSNEVQRQIFREIVHGVLVDQRILNEIFISFEENLPREVNALVNEKQFPYAYALAENLYDKGKEKPPLKNFKENFPNKKKAYDEARERIDYLLHKY